MPRQITAIAPWYGSNRTLAANVGELLRGCEWVGIAFAGSMTEVRHIKARTILVNDLHKSIINLAQVMADEEYGPMLYRELRREIFHPQTLEDAQTRLSAHSYVKSPGGDFAHARDYFISAWMSRNGTAGTARELKSQLATRWTASGGDSAKRFQGAIATIPQWRKMLRRCTFVSMDAIQFLIRVTDRAGIGVYCDPPFPGPGDKYKNTMSEEQHREMATTLSLYDHVRVVCRFYDHPLVRELYPESEWEWHFIDEVAIKTTTKENRKCC